MTIECDLAIIGGGPTGLTAAINGASEGLRTVLFDVGPTLGGQASRSSLVENYTGFPQGISGEALANAAIRQAIKFKTNIQCPANIISLRAEGKYQILRTQERREYSAGTVLVATGLSYRTLTADIVGAFAGRGVMYGAPTIPLDSYTNKTIVIVGGANSAGQAAASIAKNEKAKIKMLVRKKVVNDMSTYLLDRLQHTPNIEIIEGIEVKGVYGDERLESVTTTQGCLAADHLLIFIGALPKTYWLNGSSNVKLDDKGFVLTGEGERKPFETSCPGVFAAGDVRLGSVKRIASAVGEGAASLQSIHQHLAENDL